MVINEKEDFSRRLNEALAGIGAPEKGKGRQKALLKLMTAQGAVLTENGVRKWLECESIPAMDNMIKLARAIRVPIQWLATGEGERERNTSALPLSADGLATATLELAGRISNLTPFAKSHLESTVAFLEQISALIPAEKVEQQTQTSIALDEKKKESLKTHLLANNPHVAEKLTKQPRRPIKKADKKA